MAGSRIKGITIEIEGNTTKLQTALSDVNKDLKTTQSSLKDVNSLLKLDPTNTELLEQKQKLLKQAINDTKQKLDTEKEALRQLKEGDQTPEVIAQQEALERQIVEDEEALKNFTKEMGPFKSAGLQAFFAVGEKVKETGEKIKGIGEDITKHVTGPLAAIGAASIAAFKSVDDGYDEMIKKTGATGEEAEALREIMNNLATEIPTDFDTAGKAVGEVATRFGVTGDELEELSGQFIKFADLNNTDVSNSVDKVQKALSAFGMGSDDAGDYLDRLNKTAQETGVSTDKLADGMVTNGAAFQELGLNIDQATVFMGQLEKSGANSETVMNGMRKALKNATKEGKPLDRALSDLQETILNGTSSTDGLTAAYDMFGKSGDQIYAAVQNGTLDFEKLGQTISDAGGSIDSTFNETLDPIDQFKTTMNELKVVGAELGSTLLETLAPVIEKVKDVLQTLKEKWDSLDPKTQETIVKVGLIVAAIGPIITIVGTLVMAIGALMSPIGLVVAAIGAAIAAGVLLYQNWDEICAWAEQLKERIVEAWENLKQKVVDTVLAIRDYVVEKWENLKETVSTVVETIKTTISEKWEALKTKVVDTVTSIKNTIEEKWNAIKEKISTVVETIKTTLSEKWESIKEKVTGFVGDIKETISEKFESAKETISTAWENVKENTATAWDTIKQKVEDNGGGIEGIIQTAVEGYKSLWEGGLKFLDEITGGKLGDIYNWFDEKFNSIWDFISGIVDKIKGLFDFEWSLPSIKLPHFSWTWTDIGGIISIPNLSIEWYKKAYNNPYLFTDPTIVGGRGFGDGGGSGEIVYGRDQLMRDIAQASGGDEITINVYAPENMDVNQLADRVQERLAQVQQQRMSAYA